ncbi:molybdopterin molybdotransferase MoeA [Sphingomonas sp. M1-B02]|uniref:molybdopterin molybdotransferase MoeA n=1 Tax=Sphingomonas sp. M1-B02 TaxID=3114300 RepID=UPI00223F08EF|nr:molybdopterin molybdotransferase MoeA [Sphingomonas sp. S6-11]UZK66690.1 molybdopterin molybdotransferase MoeA [Sphingomonas sp. S6-11]
MAFVEPVGRGRDACAATLTFDAAQAILAAHATPLGVETVPLAKAGRRVLAEAIYARIDSPRYDAAAMDGFAVREHDLRAGLRQFRVVGSSYPALPWAEQLGPGETVRIMTGAAVPKGADRVVVRELVRGTPDGIELHGELSTRRHIRARGSDMAKGDLVLAAGRTLDPRALLVAAAADVGSVQVRRRPRVRLLTSGDELVAPGLAADTPHQLPDSLSEAILLMTRQYGGIPLGSRRVRDVLTDIEVAAAAALGDCDVLVMAGGASNGDRDFAKHGLMPLGLELCFADVAIKPGKPVWYGRIGNRHVLGLPGNPTAAMTIARLFLAPLLCALGGGRFATGLKWTQMPLLTTMAEIGSRETFLCAELDGRGVHIIERQSASAQWTLARANALVRGPAGHPALVAGDIVSMLGF